MNGALVLVPPPSDFDDPNRGWPAGWGWSELAPAMAKLRQQFKITSTPSMDEKHYLDEHGSAALRKALLEQANFREVNDLLSVDPEKLEGVLGTPNVATRFGLRSSPASALLPEALRSHPNLHLRLRAEVLELLLNGTEAYAVR